MGYLRGISRPLTWLFKAVLFSVGYVVYCVLVFVVLSEVAKWALATFYVGD